MPAFLIRPGRLDAVCFPLLFVINAVWSNNADSSSFYTSSRYSGRVKTVSPAAAVEQLPALKHRRLYFSDLFLTAEVTSLL